MIFTKQKKSFINQVKALNKGQTIDPEFIWKSFNGPNAQQNVSYFCLQLYEHLMHTQKKTSMLQNEQKLYATLLVMELYNNKKTKSQKLIQQCSNYIEKMQSNYGRSVLKFLFSNQREKQIAKFFISRLIMAPLQIIWSQKIQIQAKRQLISSQQHIKSKVKHGIFYKNYQSLKNASFPKFNALQTKLLTFGYICFLDHIKSNKYEIKKYQYQHLLQNLRFLMNSVGNVTILQQYLPLIIHLITKCVTYYGCFEQQIIKNLMLLTNQLRNFPSIIGKLAQQLFSLLYQQLKIPGSAFRKKLRYDFPSLDIKQHKFLNKQFYLISDIQQVYNRHQDMSLITLRKLLIFHIIKISNLQQQIINKFLLNLKILDQKKTYILYDKLIRILDVASKLDCRSKISIILKQYITKLINQTIQNNQQNAGIQKQRQADIEVQQFQQLYKKINKNGIFQYPNFAIITVSISDFISNKDNVYSLNKIVQKSKSDFQTKGIIKNKIPLIFHGDGTSFLKFVSAISKFLQNTQVQQSKQFKIYYIPRHDNTIRPGVGIYMSRKDPWYRKFLFNIHFQKILYPHLDIKPSNKDLFPFYLYNKSLQLYIRQANCNVHLRIYKCTLKRNDSSQDQCVYMTSYFGLGLFCEARIIKMNKQMEKSKQQRNYSKQLIQIIDDKIKKGPVSTLNLEIQCVQPLSQGLKLKKQKNVRIQDLQICNLSSQYFLGKQPNPSSANLQMTILTEINGKIFRKQISHSEYFKQNRSFDQVYQAFKELFICRSIRNIFIENASKNNSLKVMIDGNVFSNLETIRIQPVISVSDIPVSLQIQSFLPV